MQWVLDQTFSTDANKGQSHAAKWERVRRTGAVAWTVDTTIIPTTTTTSDCNNGRVLWVVETVRTPKYCDAHLAGWNSSLLQCFIRFLIRESNHGECARGSARIDHANEEKEVDATEQ